MNTTIFLDLLEKSGLPSMPFWCFLRYNPARLFGSISMPDSLLILDISSLLCFFDILSILYFRVSGKPPKFISSFEHPLNNCLNDIHRDCIPHHPVSLGVREPLRPVVWESLQPFALCWGQSPYVPA